MTDKAQTAQQIEKQLHQLGVDAVAIDGPPFNSSLIRVVLPDPAEIDKLVGLLQNYQES